MLRAERSRSTPTELPQIDVNLICLNHGDLSERILVPCPENTRTLPQKKFENPAMTELQSMSTGLINITKPKIAVIQQQT